jgi:thiol-disulfide isomerase/thioredoxin
MAATPSNMVQLGTPAPGFSLPDTISGNMLELGDVKGEAGTVIMFTCNHCPYVKLLNPELIRLARDYMPKGVRLVAISSNDVVQYPDDGPWK